MLIDFAQQYVQALASADAERIARWYHPDARSYGPLAWPQQGAPAIAAALAGRRRGWTARRPSCTTSSPTTQVIGRRCA